MLAGAPLLSAPPRAAAARRWLASAVELRRRRAGLCGGRRYRPLCVVAARCYCRARSGSRRARSGPARGWSSPGARRPGRRPRGRGGGGVWAASFSSAWRSRGGRGSRARAQYLSEFGSAAEGHRGWQVSRGAEAPAGTCRLVAEVCHGARMVARRRGIWWARRRFRCLADGGRLEGGAGLSCMEAGAAAPGFKVVLLACLWPRGRQSMLPWAWAASLLPVALLRL